MPAETPTEIQPTSVQQEETKDPPVIDIDPRKDIMTQIRDFAATQGRRTIKGFEEDRQLENDDPAKNAHVSIEGLTYRQGGLTYRVSSDIAHYKTEAHKKKRWLLPSFSRQIGGAHKIIYERQATEQITLEGYRGSRLVSHIRMEGSEFEKFMNDRLSDRLTGKLPEDRCIKDLRLEEERPRPEATEHKKIDVSLKDVKKGVSVLDAVLNAQEAEGLSDLRGLSWTRDGYAHRVTEDIVTPQVTNRGARMLRKFVIEVKNARGQIINHHTLSLEQLHKHLEVMNAPQNPKLELRFEIPKTPHSMDHPEEQAWLGMVASQKPATQEQTVEPPAEDAAAGQELSAEDAAKMVAGHYVHQGEDRKEYFSALQTMVKEIGTEKLNGLVEYLIGQYQENLQRLGFRIHKPDWDRRWFYSELARQRYLAAKLGDNKKYDGLTVHDPLDGSTQALQTLRDIVDMRIGKRYAELVLHDKVEYAKAFKEAGGESSGRGHEEYKEAIVGHTVVDLETSVTGLLQPYTRERVEKIMRQAVGTHRQERAQKLSSGDLARVGRLLRRASNSSLF